MAPLKLLTLPCWGYDSAVRIGVSNCSKNGPITNSWRCKRSVLQGFLAPEKWRPTIVIRTVAVNGANLSDGLSMEPSAEMAGKTHPEHAVTTGQSATKRRQRKRLPAPKCRTPRAAIRRFNTLVTKFTREVSGGRELLTAESEMVRQAAAIMLRAEQLQAGIVRGEAIDPDELIRLSSEGRRVLRSIRAGVKPEAPPPPPWSPLRARHGITAAPKPEVAK
jgi:hypothetical protein